MNHMNLTNIQTTTFLLRILFRENTTWQGHIDWLEGNKSRAFRSLLELIMLMQEAQPNDAFSTGKAVWNKNRGFKVKQSNEKRNVKRLDKLPQGSKNHFIKK